ncbi:MAG: MMPL family transporter [Lachnospiraceae bacterium]|nr:MMPL family transporter [Lachnospiraceae bacterium]
MNTKIGKKKDTNIMKLISKTIVKDRYLIMALFVSLAIFCVFSISKVKVNEDITAFLPDDTETRQGLTIMEDEFITYASADIMISNITYNTAEKIADMLEKEEHVTTVTLDDSKAHYVNSSALISLAFDGTSSDEKIIAAMESIKDKIKDYDVYISTEIGQNYSKEVASQMGGVLLLAVVVILFVLLFTSRSYFEVVIFGIVFIFAAVLNMGTNYLLGEISSITNSIAVILQLALAIDYSIILIHRYQDEVLIRETEKEALIEALSKGIIEISSSSLTTISGLLALTLMQFRLGYDLGVVLTKGIIFSILSVLLLMPGIICLFPKMLKKTAHKSHVPSITFWGKFLMNSKYCFVFVFFVLIPLSIYFSSKTEYAFADSTIDELIYSESRMTMHKIEDTFDNSTTIALIVPNGDYASEKEIIKDIEVMDNVKSVTGLANIEIEENRVLTDKYTPRMFAELLDIDIEQATLMYQAYGVENKQYQGIFKSPEEYEVPLIDMFLFLFDKTDKGIINLDDTKNEQMQSLRGQLMKGIEQLQGDNYDRIIVTATVPVEGAESTRLVDNIRSEAKKHYEDSDMNVLVIGEITSAKDLNDTFNGDSAKINFLTILFVLIILLLTFRTVAGSCLLVFVIQGSIWMNFSFPYLTGITCSFVTNMIVSAIQMGATIDYAIVIMNHYQDLKKNNKRKDAMIQAVDESFPTILTSGTILTMAGFLISMKVSDVYIGHIGLAVGRGALISVILVLTVLPQIIVLFDKLIDRTRFTIVLGGDRK